MSKARASLTVSFSVGLVPYTDGNVLYLTLSSDDQASLILAAGLADNETTTFLVIATILSSTTGNAAKAYANTTAYAVDIFVPDTTPPYLSQYDLNMDSGVFSLVFSEPVDVSSSNMTAVLVMEKTVSTEGAVYRLTGGTLLDGDGKIVRVQISDSDITALKNTAGLVRELASTYVK